MRDSESLYESYRQSLKELWTILILLATFVGWNVGAGSLLAFELPEPGQPIQMIFGMPRWAFITLLAPWIAGNLCIFWFAFWVLKDTTLNETSVADNGAEDAC